MTFRKPPLYSGCSWSWILTLLMNWESQHMTAKFVRMVLQRLSKGYQGYLCKGIGSQSHTINWLEAIYRPLSRHRCHVIALWIHKIWTECLGREDLHSEDFPPITAEQKRNGSGFHWEPKGYLIIRKDTKSYAISKWFNFFFFFWKFNSQLESGIEGSRLTKPPSTHGSRDFPGTQHSTGTEKECRWWYAWFCLAQPCSQEAITDSACISLTRIQSLGLT